MPKDPVTVIGTGRMGAHYVQRLCASGRPVYAWNRTPARAERLTAAGARIVPTAAAAIAAAPFVIVALENAAAFRGVMLASAALQALSADHLVIDMGTTLPSQARAHATALQAAGCHFVDVPVSGGTRGAAEGTLTLLGGGNERDLDRAGPVLAPLGRLHRLGPIGAGQAAKLANQVIVALTIAAVSEGLHLAGTAGLDLQAIVEALQGGFAESRVLREHGARMARGDFDAGATNRVFLKDLEAVETLADEVGVALPLTARVRVVFAQLVAQGRGDADHSSYIEHLQNHTLRD